MHPRNKHISGYNFKALQEVNPILKEHIVIKSNGESSINFNSSEAVYHLNKALLALHYSAKDWSIPKEYLCPPIPGRVDYIHYVADLLNENNMASAAVRGLDIGVGANCIYPILAVNSYEWSMVGADSNSESINIAKTNAAPFSEKIEIRQQFDNAHIFQGIIKPDEYFHFSMCNPPFYGSKEEAEKMNRAKNTGIGRHTAVSRNFGGQAPELWCNGGEALFVKRLIKQSRSYKSQVGWFTCLISKKAHLPKFYKQLDKVKAVYKTIPMEQGNKASRIIAWSFNS